MAIMTLPRLDLLIYAHDGRGLGHASRGIAIGMAVRRLFPELKVLFVSGARAASDLIHTSGLDWIKLPAYETLVIKGKSQGRTGLSNFSDADLGRLRADMLKSIVTLYRPRCVLADHMPQGKHKELRPALEAADPLETRWVLGMRGVIGGVRQVWSDLAVSLFKARYHALLWYGDAHILGRSHLKDLAAQFGMQPVETGYVSRLSELAHWDSALGAPDPALAGTVSIPWAGEGSFSLLHHLAGAIEKIGDAHGRWRIFVDFGNAPGKMKQAVKIFKRVSYCRVEPAGRRYVQALLNAKVSVIYGGYNSLTDVLCAQKPSVVILRDMQDKEQEAHAARLSDRLGAGLVFVEEKKVNQEVLTGALTRHLTGSGIINGSLRLNGAETAAKTIAGLISE